TCQPANNGVDLCLCPPLFLCLSDIVRIDARNARLENSVFGCHENGNFNNLTSRSQAPLGDASCAAPASRMLMPKTPCTYRISDRLERRALMVVSLRQRKLCQDGRA